MDQKNRWKLEKYRAEEIENNIRARKFIVPLYQRGLVWKKDKKEDFIDTLKRGLPFGSILLYHDEQRHNYQIIDGLQRCSTIFEFIQNPAEFFREDDIDDEAIRNIVSCLNMNGSREAQGVEIRNMLIHWVKENHKTMQDVADMQYIGFVYLLLHDYPLAHGREMEIVDYIRPALQRYWKVCKQIQEIEIPALVIEGDDSVLPMVFKRINSSGVKLNKYEICAAAWTEKKYVISSAKLFDLVLYNRDRYEQMLRGKAALADFDAPAFLQARELNAFEIAFGLGKYLSKHYPHLFVERKEGQLESAGFTLINICLGRRSDSTKDMNVWLEKLVGQGRMNLFLERIIQCVEYVDARIGKYNKFKANSRKFVGPLHTEYQILSLVVFVFIQRYVAYSFDDEGQLSSFSLHLDCSDPGWESLATEFRANAAKRYISDILYKRWSGAGDKRLNAQQFSRDYYTKRITKQEFSASLRQWFIDDTRDRNESTSFPNPKEPEKLLLALVYLPRFSAQDHLDASKYDIEHLATKGIMRRRLRGYGGQVTLPVSSIANLCLLPEAENRSKGDKTIYGDGSYLKKSKFSLEELEEDFTFTKYEDLAWIENENLDADSFSNHYHAFIEKRFAKILDIVLENFEHI